MKRRQFITCFGATVAANTLTCSLAARAQQPAMPSGALPSSAKPDNPANGLDPLLQQAQTLGAPMAAVARAITISRQQTFAKKDALAVFDISQPSANKRFYLLDFKSGEATAHYAAHGRSNGPNAKAVKFKGFQRDLDMVPLGPLKTAHSEVMGHYKTIVDRYDGTVYRNMIVAVLQGVTSYNSYINHTPPFKYVYERLKIRRVWRYASCCHTGKTNLITGGLRSPNSFFTMASDWARAAGRPDSQSSQNRRHLVNDKNRSLR